MRGRVELPIHTARLTIRPLTLDDAEALHELYSDPTAMRHLASDLPADVEGSRRWVQDKIEQHERTGLSLWALESTATGDVVGDAGLQLLEDGETVEVAVRIIRRLWRQGYGSETARALVTAAFRHLDVDRIVAVTAPENAAALGALQKHGMAPLGRQRHFGQEWLVYEIVRPVRPGDV